MKLYVTAYPKQAQNALGDFKGQKVNYIMTEGTFKGILRHNKKIGSYYIANSTGRMFIAPANIILIVNDEKETRILTNI